MAWKTLGMAAIALAALVNNASASVLLDFNGVGNGASVIDYYNGGTDSLGNAGINYGIHFNGGVANNGVVSGPFSITFSPTNNVSQVDFLMTQTLAPETYIATFSALYGEDRLNVDNTRNLGLTSNRLIYDSFAGLYRIDFNVSQLDNLRFTSASWNAPVGDSANGTVPEPGSIALLGLGALGLLGARRRA